MNLHSLKIVLRRCFQNPVYATINIIGLSLSLTVTLLIYSFIVKEVRTDRFHENGKNIYRVLRKDPASASFDAQNCEPLAPTAQARIPGIKNYARLWTNDLFVQTDRSTETGPKEHCIHADASLFQMFTFPLLQGEPTSGVSKGWAVISRQAATRYFGTEDPVGHTLTVSDKNNFFFRKPHTYQIASVMQDIPGWSTIQADFILDYKDVAGFSDWNNNAQLYTFLELEKGKHPEKVAENITQIFTEVYRQNTIQIELQPLFDIYFNEKGVFYYSEDPYVPQGSAYLTQILCGITLLIFLLATSNYMMIKIAGNRTLETFAIQRSLGADNYTLKKQFFHETVLFFLIAGIISGIMTTALFPAFQEIVSPQVHFDFPIDFISTSLFLILIFCWISIITHLLSQYFIRNLNRKGIKNTLQISHRDFDLKKILTVASMVIFSTLIIGTAIVNKQMDYLKNKDLGFDQQNMLAVEGCGETLKSELLSHPDILAASTGWTLPDIEEPFITLECSFETTAGNGPQAEVICGDRDFLNTYRISLLEGSNFNSNSLPSSQGVIPVLVNREFVKKAGLSQSVGTFFKGKDPEEPDEAPQTFQIIGITEDFHLHSLYQAVSPLILVYSNGPESGGYCNTGITNIRYRENKKAEVLQYLKKMEISYRPGFQYAELYGKEQIFVRLIDISAFIAIFIGGLGVFAFSVFYTTNKRKEIALRKINGATAWEIQELLNKEFIKLTAYACIIGFPLAYYALNLWLEKFAYKTTLNWYFFLLSAAICLFFVLLTTIWQIHKATTVNPVDCLKSE